MTKPEFIAAHPDFPWLSSDVPDVLDRLLHRGGFLPAGTYVTACPKAGEGNMNLTLRAALSDGRSVIVKQSRPWVEKYDFIAAPWDRALSELRFYERTRDIAAVASRMPKLLAADHEARVLVLEDLGPARDLTPVYTGGALSPETLTDLAAYARALHGATRTTSPDPALANREMRSLNHAHIYAIPFRRDNGLDLAKIEPSLPEAAEHLRTDSTYTALVEQTGRHYLADGPCLLHGDFFPGSFLSTPHGTRVIDPEFCYSGDPEFDLANTVAHLALARQPRAAADAFLSAYGASNVDPALLARYAACEVMRRLIGYAQLPIQPGPWRADLLARSRRALLASSIDELWP